MRGYSLILLGLSRRWPSPAGSRCRDGLIDRNGKPIGTDFSNVYAAGALTWQGRAADAYRRPLQHAAEKAVFDGREVPFYGWHYPPFFFAIAVARRRLALCLGSGDLAGRELCRLSRRRSRAILPRAGDAGCVGARPFRPCSSISATARTDFSPPALLGGALHWLDRTAVRWPAC